MTFCPGRAGDGRRPAYVGIDVAVARTKRLPLCVREAGRLVPLCLTRAASRPPHGMGNVVALEEAATAAFAEDAAAYLRAVEDEYGVRVARVAIDAPRGPAPAGGRRVSEAGLAARGIPFFLTPDEAGWTRVRADVRGFTLPAPAGTADVLSRGCRHARSRVSLP